jgi:hypothetical protein
VPSSSGSVRGFPRVPRQSEACLRVREKVQGVRRCSTRSGIRHPGVSVRLNDRPTLPRSPGDVNAPAGATLIDARRRSSMGGLRATCISRLRKTQLSQPRRHDLQLARRGARGEHAQPVLQVQASSNDPSRDGRSGSYPASRGAPRETADGVVNWSLRWARARRRIVSHMMMVRPSTCNSRRTPGQL